MIYYRKNNNNNNNNNNKKQLESMKSLSIKSLIKTIIFHSILRAFYFPSLLIVLIKHNNLLQETFYIFVITH